MIDPDIFSSRETLLPHIRSRLGQSPLDFSDMWHTNRRERQSGEEHGVAGVLLLLHVRSFSKTSSGEFVLQLIKRSSRVSQGGDIGCPGGMLHPLVDHGLAFLTRSRIIPAFHGPSREYARKRSPDVYRIINLFLANAMRESWEEIGLNPFNVEFLGPLPTYTLSLVRRTIFPLVAYVRNPWTFRTNSEVDKVIEIPLHQLFEKSHYGELNISVPAKMHAPVDWPKNWPCFVHQDSGDHREILWGATFCIVMSFLNIVFNFQQPEISSTQQYKSVLPNHYLTGRLGSEERGGDEAGS
jgi:8-oxo-dGTP pyrophosphatase MutT (NUDIX family)